MRALQHLRIYREARAYVNANDDRVALDILWTLNHLARANFGDLQYTIYACKHAAIRNLYERGLCVSLTKQTQTQTCWRCDGTGIEPYETYDVEGGWCLKCGGSGIWAQHALYQFVFEVCGKRYVWHQPEKLVTWPVMVTDETIAEYVPLPIDPLHVYLREYPAHLIPIHIAILHAYLRKHGVPADSLPAVTTLWGYARLVFRGMTRRVKNRWHDFKYRNALMDTDIPF